MAKPDAVARLVAAYGSLRIATPCSDTSHASFPCARQIWSMAFQRLISAGGNVVTASAGTDARSIGTAVLVDNSASTSVIDLFVAVMETSSVLPRAIACFCSRDASWPINDPARASMHAALATAADVEDVVSRCEGAIP